jgi:hypothetical protein
VLRTLSIRVALPCAALAAVCVLPAPAAAAECKNLKVTDGLKSDLHDAHERLTDRPFSGPKQRTYYGRCGTTRYALASFKDKELGFQDQPERFNRRPGHAWRDRGDTGGDVCGTAPRALLRIWGFAC